MRLSLFVCAGYFLCLMICFQSEASDSSSLPSPLKKLLYRSLPGAFLQTPYTLLKQEVQNEKDTYALPSSSGKTSAESAIEKTKKNNIAPFAPVSLEQAIHHLHSKRFLLASKMFLELLESDSLKETSHAKRVITYNLALAYFWQDEQGKALGNLRRLLFSNPYNPLLRKTLSQMKDHFVFWLWIPPEPVGVLLTVMAIISLILLKKKNYPLLIGLLVPFLGLYSAGFWYFYKRGQSYATVVKDSVCLSSPDKKAPKICELEATLLVQILRTTEDDNNTRWHHVSSRNRQTGWIPEEVLIHLRPR